MRLETEAGDGLDSEPSDTPRDGSFMQWAASGHMLQHLREAIEARRKIGNDLLLECASTTDPKIARLHGQYQQAETQVRVLKKLAGVTK